MTNDAWWQGALGMCAIITVGLFAVWVILSPWRTPTCPTVVAAPVAAAAPEDAHERLLHRFCDKEVEILLQSHDLVDLIRAAIVVHQINCDIENRI